MAARHDFELDQGSFWSRQLLWKDADGDPINLTGWHARMQLRESVKASSALLSLSDGAGITLGGAAGTIDVAITADQSADLPAGTLVYDLEMVPANGEVKRLIQGVFDVSAEVTR